MNKRQISRRGFLDRIAKITSAAVLAKFLKFIPEASTVFANTGGSKNGYPPKDANIQQLSGDEAQKIIEYSINNKTSQQLQNFLSDFSPQLDNAFVISVSWTDEETKENLEGPAAAITLKNGSDVEAYLYFSSINGDDQFALVKPLINNQKFEAVDVYTVQDNAIGTQRVDVSQTRSDLCTVDCMVQCLQLYGCSGYAITVCMASIIACVAAPPACIVAYACTLYCGGAFSICFTDFCCADA